MKRHAEETGEAVKQGGRVGDEEDEDDDGRTDLQGLALEPLAEELGHGGGVKMLGHDAGPPTQHDPGHQGAKNGVADARPSRGHAVLPAKLARVAHKDHGGEVRGAVGKGRQPRADRPATQHKAVHVCGVLAAVNADAHHDCEVDHKKRDFHRDTSVRDNFSAFKL